MNVCFSFAKKEVKLLDQGKLLKKTRRRLDLVNSSNFLNRAFLCSFVSSTLVNKSTNLYLGVLICADTLEYCFNSWFDLEFSLVV
jgi:hypothetical protein